MYLLRYRDIRLELPKRMFHTRIQGFFRCRVLNPDRNWAVKTDTGWFPNLILDRGLNFIGGGMGGSYFLHTYCAIGTGNATPDVTQTTLQSYVTSVSSNSNPAPSLSSWPTTEWGSVSHQTTSPYYMSSINGWRFTGLNNTFAELGTGNSTVPLLCTRTLIKDSGGNPTTITVNTGEVLDVYYCLRCYPYLSDVSLNFDVSGTTHTGTARSGMCGNGFTKNYQMFSFAGAQYWLPAENGNGYGNTYSAGATIGAITTSPTATTGAGIWPPNDGTSITSSTYVTDTFYRESTYIFQLNYHNFSGGMGGALLYNGVGTFQYVWTPAVPKDNTKVFSLTTSCSWGRYT